MKVKNNKSLLLGITMLIIGILFFIYALLNPEMSFPWKNSITYIIYILYIIITIVFIKKGIKKE